MPVQSFSLLPLGLLAALALLVASTASAAAPPPSDPPDLYHRLDAEKVVELLHLKDAVKNRKVLQIMRAYRDKRQALADRRDSSGLQNMKRLRERVRGLRADTERVLAGILGPKELHKWNDVMDLFEKAPPIYGSDQEPGAWNGPVTGDTGTPTPGHTPGMVGVEL